MAQAVSQVMSVLARVEAAAPEELSTDALYRRWAPYVWRILGAMGVATADIPDLTQEAFLVVHRRLHELREPARSRAWIYGICIRCAANYRRRAHRKNELLCEAVPEPSTPTDPEVARIDLLRALDRLDDARRAVFVLYEIEELSMPEVAEVLGCPVTTAYCRLYSARKAVRAAMAGEAARKEGSRVAR